jgi:hypothetical protein
MDGQTNRWMDGWVDGLDGAIVFPVQRSHSKCFGSCVVWLVHKQQILAEFLFNLHDDLNSCSHMGCFFPLFIYFFICLFVYSSRIKVNNLCLGG